MDPIHPIHASPPNIPAVTPAPLTRAVDRDAARERDAKDERRRRQPKPEDDDAATDGPHVDVTA